MLAVSAALSTFIAGAASREVESQLQSSGAVYDRLWQQRAHELQNAAQLLARDFGFRAAVLANSNGRWSEAAGSMSVLSGDSAALAQNHMESRAAFEMRVGDTTSIALSKPLPAFGDGERAILLLAYPKAEALADARKLQLTLAAMTLLGLLLVGLATWRAAGRITQPLARLDEAAGRLASGEHVQVRVRGEG